MTELLLPPPDFLPTESQKWGRWVRDSLQRVARDQTTETSQRKASSSTQNDTIAVLRNQVATLQDTNARLQNAVTLLTAAGQVALDEQQPNATITAVGFYNGAGRPSVTVTSPTGRIAVQFGGSINSGNAEIVFSAVGANGTTYMDRSAMRTNYAQRIALSGGASFTPSAYRSTVLNVDANVAVTLQLEVWAENASLFFVGGSIQAGASL